MQLGGGFEIGRWWHGCALLTMSPLPTVISWRNTICLVSTIHSDISLFLLEEDFGGWTAGAAAADNFVKSQNKLLVLTFFE